MTHVFPARKFLMNAGSSNMVVNGSVTPVVFSYAPVAGEVFSLDELILSISGSGNINDPAQFWNFAALTNGFNADLKLGLYTNSQTGLIKTNIEMIHFIGADFIGKTMGAHNIVRGSIPFKVPITLNGTRGDYYHFTVMDNLTTGSSLETFTIGLRGTMVTKP